MASQLGNHFARRLKLWLIILLAVLAAPAVYGQTTLQVTSLNPGFPHLTLGDVASVGNVAYFAAEMASGQKQLYSYDPGEDLLTQLTNFTYVNSDEASIGNLVVANNKIYFGAKDVPGSSLSLWVYNPSSPEAGANKCKKLGGGYDPSGWVAYNGKLYGRSAVNSGNILALDPSNDTITFPVNLGHVDYLTVVGSKLFFRASNSDGSNAELYEWPFSGSPVVHDIISGGEGSEPESLVACNGKLYFEAYDPAKGNQLFEADPATTPATVTCLTNLSAGAGAGMNITKLIEAGGKIFIQRAYNSFTYGYELMVYDPVAKTTGWIDLNAGAGSSSPSDFFVTGGKLYCAATGASGGRELWKINPADNTAQLVSDIQAGGDSNPSGFSLFSNKMYFAAKGSQGRELYACDPSNDSVSLAWDIVAGSGDSNPQRLTAAAKLLYFSAKGTGGNNQLWYFTYNHAPSLTGSGGAIGYTENDPALVLDNTISASDADADNLVKAKVSITAGLTTGDTLTFTSQFGVTGSYSSATGVLTLTGDTSPANFQAVLRSVAFSSSSDNPTATSATRTIQTWITDGAGKSNVLTKTINITAVNDAPVVANGSTVTFTENAAAVTVGGAITITDPDNTTLSSAVVQISSGLTAGDVLGFVNQNGITGSYNTATGVLTLSGVATVAQYQAALRSITYQSTSENPAGTAAARTISFTTNDGSTNSAVFTSTVNVIGINDAPTLTGLNLPVHFMENTVNAAPQLIISGSVTVADVDSADFNTGALTVAYQPGGDAQDQLSIRNQGFGPGQIGVGGTVVLYGGTPIGNINSSSNGVNGANLVIDLFAGATPQAVKALIENLTYRNTSDSPYETRVIGITINDGDGGISASQIVAIDVTTENDAPTVTTSGGLVAYTEGAAGATIDGAITVSDPDSVFMEGAIVAITGNFSAGDTLNFINQSRITGSYNSATGVLTLSGSTSIATYQSALASITYSSTSHNPTAASASRTVSFLVNDGALLSAVATRTLTITPVNDPPLVTAGGTLNYTEGDSAKAIDNTITVTDPDSALISNATVSISNGLMAADDELSLSPQSGITATYNAATGTLSLQGTATLANYQAALRQVSFRSTSKNPTNYGANTSRTISIAANDTDGASSTAGTSTINITAVNDVPTLTGAGTPLSYTENDPALVIDNSIAIADLDNQTLAGATVTIASGYTQGDVLEATTQGGVTMAFNGSVLTLSGTAPLATYQAILRTVTYQSTSDDPTETSASRSFSFVVNDGSGDSTPQSRALTITPVNDPPVVTAGASASYTENGTAVALDNTITVTDPDNAKLTGAVVKISAGLTDGDVLSLADQNGIRGSYNAATGELTLSGSDAAANYQTALRLVTFSSTSDNPTANSTSRTITYTVSDGTVTSQAVTSTITVIPVNDTPVITEGSSTLVSMDEDGTPTSFSLTLHATDVENDALSWSISRAAGNGSAGISGTGNTIQVSYTPNKDYNGNDNFDVTVDDGHSGTATIRVNVAIAAQDDPPVVTAGATVNFTENGSAVAIDNAATVTDIDSANLTGAMVYISAGFTDGDVLGFMNQNGITGSYNAARGELSLSGPATLAAFQVALRSVTYSSTSDDPAASSASRTITYVVADDMNHSQPVTSTITVIPVNDPPTLSGTVSGLQVDDDSTTAPFTSVAIHDVDSPAQDQIVRVALDDAAKGVITTDSLTASGFSDAGQGIYNFTGKDSAAQVALRKLVFAPTRNHVPADQTETTTFTVTVNDGVAADVIDKATSVISLSINDAPELTAGGELAAINEDDVNSPGQTIGSLFAGKFADPDAQASLSGVAVVGNAANAATEGAWQYQGTDSQWHDIGTVDDGPNGLALAALTLVRFVPAANYNGTPGALTVRALDETYDGEFSAVQGAGARVNVDTTDNGGVTAISSGTQPITIGATAQNDAPAITAGAAVGYTEKAAPITIDNAIQVSDIDNADLTSATVSLQGFTAGDILTFASQNGITGSYNDATGEMKLVGTASVANYQAALRTITYHSTSKNPTAGSATRMVQFIVSDGALSSTAASCTITITPVNDAPEVTAGAVTGYTEKNGGVVIDGNLTLGDPDNTKLQGATVAITSGFTGGDVLTFVNQAGITGSYNATTGELALTGEATLADYQAALRSVTYHSTSANPTGTAPSRTIRFTASDGDLTGSATSTINVTGINDAPVIAEGDEATVNMDEDGSPTSFSLTLNATDGENDTLTWSVHTAATNGQAEVSGTGTAKAVRYTPNANYNGQDSFVVEVSDGNSGSDTITVKVNIAAQNDVPTDVGLSNATVDEDQAAGKLVGTLNGTDVDTGDTYQYSLVSGEGDRGNASFTINNDQLLTSAVFDYETTSTYSVRIRVTDSKGGTFEKPFTINVRDLNDAPTDLSLSNSKVSENLPAQTAVGQFTTTDQDQNDTHAYTLVSGDGDTDNGSFVIDGATLKTNARFDFETKSGYTVRVQTDDGKGGKFAKAFTLSVTDINDQPTNITLSPATVEENKPEGTIVGTLSASDQDAGDSVSYALVDGDGAADNGSFVIDGATIKTKATFNYEEKPSCQIRIQALDTKGGSTDAVFTIKINNVNEAPLAKADAGMTDEDTTLTVQAQNGLLANDSDPDAGDTLAVKASDPKSARGADVKVNSDGGYSYDPTVSPELRALAQGQTAIDTFNYTISDHDGLTSTALVSITVSGRNDAPTQVGLSKASVAENQPAGTVVGTLSGTDPDQGDTLTYSLADGEGGGDNTTFVIDGTQLKTAQSFDYETKSTYSIRVRAADPFGGTIEHIFTISVTDANDAPTAIGISTDTISENQPAGTVVGTLSATDQDAGDSLHFALVTGDGDTNNGAFTIDANQLKSTAIFDYEAKNSYSIRVQATDGTGATFSRKIIITVADANDPPMDITLSNASVTEKLPAGTLVGELSTADQDQGDSHSYSFAAGPGDQDNAKFTLDGSQLKTNASFNAQTDGPFSIRVQAADGRGGLFAKQLSITITRANDTDKPVIQSGPTISAVTNRSAMIQWQTNEPATGAISYGTAAGNLDKTVSLTQAGLSQQAMLDGLTTGTLYYVRVACTDGAGNGPTLSGVLTFRTLQAADNHPPVIIDGPLPTTVSDTYVEIRWTTNEPSTSKIAFSDGSTNGVLQESALVTRHTMILRGLKPATKHSFTVESVDSHGNGPTVSAPLDFMTLAAPDTSKPVMLGSPLVVGLNDHSATINWMTDEPATSIVELEAAGSTQLQQFSSAQLAQSHNVTLDNLTPGTTYSYRVQSFDTYGNGPMTSDSFTFTTDAALDTHAPVILEGPKIIGLTDKTATIYWRTDEPSDSVIEYGTDGDLDRRQSDTARSTVHQITLVNLEPGKAYSFIISSTDASGNTVTAGYGVGLSGVSGAMRLSDAGSQFTTMLVPDTTAPTFTDGPRVVSVSNTSAIISWTTNEIADERVEYGLDGVGLTNFIGNIDRNFDHLVILTNLTANTTYQFRVSTQDVSGNVVTSALAAFRTNAQPDTTPPLFTVNPVVSGITKIAAQIDWQTGELATGQVEFGTRPTDLGHITALGGLRTNHSINLINLTEGTTYYYVVTVEDTAGNTTKSPVMSFETRRSLTPPELQVTVEAGVASATPGSAISYTITYTNQGETTATGVALSFIPPVSSSFQEADSAGDWFPLSDGAYGMRVGPLGPGSQGSARFSVVMEYAAPDLISQLTGTVRIGNDGKNGPDANLANNTATATTSLSHPKGTLSIQPSPAYAPWRLTGPGVAQDGNGTATLTAMPAGNYTLEWQDQSCWIKPPSATHILLDGETYTFSGNYTPDGNKALSVRLAGSLRRFTRGDTVQINWTSHWPVTGSVVKVDLWNSHGFVAKLGSSWSVTGEGTLTARVPNVPASLDYKLHCTSIWNPLFWTESQESFSIGGSPVTIDITSAGGQYAVNSQMRIYWTTIQPLAGNTVKLEIWDSKGRVAELGQDRSENCQDVWTFRLPQIPAAKDYRIRAISTQVPTLWAESSAPFEIMKGSAADPAGWPCYE